MLRKFLSRKFLAAVAAFIAVNVSPALPPRWQAGLSAAVAAIYAIAEAYVDAAGARR